SLTTFPVLEFPFVRLFWACRFGSSRAIGQRHTSCYRPVQSLNQSKTSGGKPSGLLPTAVAEIIGRLMVKHFGLDPDKDVKFVPGGSGEGRYIRMRQGLLDATVATVPTEYIGRKMGFPIMVRSEDLFTYPFSGLTVTMKKLKEKPDEIKRVIRAGIKANR